MRVAGKSVVVTGGANGIGRALGERFAAEGARGVVVADINAEWARKVADRASPSRISDRNSSSAARTRVNSRGSSLRCPIPAASATINRNAAPPISASAAESAMGGPRDLRGKRSHPNRNAYPIG